MESCSHHTTFGSVAADRNIWNWRWNNIAGLSANHFVIVTAGSFSEDESLFSPRLGHFVGNGFRGRRFC